MTVRQRFTHASLVGLMAAAVVVAIQFFVGVPVGDQPAWLGTLALLSGIPAAYALHLLRGPIDAILPPPTDQRFFEVETLFGPAFRASVDEMLLLALGTVVMVGLVAYLASGLTEMLRERTG